MNPSTPSSPTDLAALARHLASEVVWWTFGLAELSVVLTLAVAGAVR